MADRAGKQRKPRKLTWRRIPSRMVLFVAFFAGIAALVLGVFPFDSIDGDRTLKCGPPLFEVVVPADESFDVPENAGCPEPARRRVVISAALLGGVFVLTTLTELRSRRLTALSQQKWLEGPRRRPTRAERRRDAADGQTSDEQTSDELSSR